MLQIKTIKNSLITDDSKDSYCFRSSCSQTISLEELASEMTDYNSSFTKADILGMLNILETVGIKYMTQGVNLTIPFGIMRPAVSGTCQNINDSFVLGSSNHTVSVLFSPNATTQRMLKENLKYKQLSPDTTTEPKIYRICTLLKTSQESNSFEPQKGKILRLRGRNLGFDFEDEAQGVFLENENAKVKITEFARKGTSIVDAYIPQDIENGQYSLTLVSKPGITYFTADIDKIISLTA